MFAVLNITQCGLENADNVYAAHIHNILGKRRGILEDMNLQHRRRENFVGYNVLFVCHMTGALMIT